MGSFANSLHVQWEDSEKIAAAITKLLRAEGYEATDAEPDEAALWGLSSSRRAIRVARAHDGLVGVLDSDLVGGLAEGLSRELDTYAVHCMVFDSNSWHFKLCDRGDEIDSFESCTDDVEMLHIGELSEDLVQASEMRAWMRGIAARCVHSRRSWRKEGRRTFANSKRG